MFRMEGLRHPGRTVRLLLDGLTLVCLIRLVDSQDLFRVVMSLISGGIG